MQTLIKNTRAYKLLKAETAKNRLAHAYLVLLDDSRNLRAALKTFAKILFGADEPLSPAQKRIADLIEAESFSDCLFFPAPDKKFMVEDAEKIAEESALKAVGREKSIRRRGLCRGNDCGAKQAFKAFRRTAPRGSVSAWRNDGVSRVVNGAFPCGKIRNTALFRGGNFRLLNPI